MYRLLSLVVMTVSLGACSIRPDVTAAVVESTIVGKTVEYGRHSTWRFESSEVRSIQVVEQEKQWSMATVIVEIDTIDPGVIDDDHMKGRLRLQYEWIAGRWELLGLENLSFRDMDD